MKLKNLAGNNIVPAIVIPWPREQWFRFNVEIPTAIKYFSDLYMKFLYQKYVFVPVPVPLSLITKGHEKENQN